MTKKKVEKNTPPVKPGEAVDPLDLKKEDLKKDTSAKGPATFKAFAPSKGQMNMIAFCSIVMGTQKGLLAMFWTLTALILIFYTF